MFNQQQQFHQLMQLQQLLQQQQHPPPAPQHHPGPRPMPPPAQHQQPPQMLALRAPNPARLLNAHPMLQRALLMQHMQGNLRSLSMGGPPMQHFFPPASHHSILGTPPLGVTVKAPQMGFPGHPFQQQHHRMYHKDQYRGYDRKREGERGPSFQARRGGDDKRSEKEDAELPPAASEADENASSPDDSENIMECSISDAPEPASKRARSSKTGVDTDFQAGGITEEEEEGAAGRSVESEPPEGVSAGRALKVTIQQRSESRTISNTALTPAVNAGSSAAQSGPSFCCYICKTNCHSLQAFQSHLVTARHHQRFQEIQHISKACLVTLLPTARDSAAGRDGKKQVRWCNVCQVHFSSDLIKHRRTPEHKLAKRSLRPFCTVCSRHFKTPRKFVEHMKSPEHKLKSQEVRLLEKEPWGPDESEEMITVDAVGCFEDEDDDDDEEEEGISEDDSSADTEGLLDGAEEIRFADSEGGEEYSADTAYGLDFVVPVAGYLCRLCHKYYPSDSAARHTHCKSLMHFQNVQRYKAAKNRMAAQRESASHTPKPASQADEPAPCEEQPGEELNAAEQTEADPETVQGERSGDAGPPARAESLADEKGGDLALAEERETSSVASRDPGAAADSLVTTSEEDAGSVLEPETLLTQKDPESHSQEEEPINTPPEQETCAPQEDISGSSCRRSSRHKLR